MEPYLITFRIIHILTALAWFGAAFVFDFFVAPTARALGPEAEKFMTHLSKERKISVVISMIAGTTLVSGGFLFWHDSNGFDLDWITSDVGLGFTVGAVAAVIAYAIGITVIAPTVKRMERFVGEIRVAGGPPTEEQMAGMAKIQRKLEIGGRTSFIFLVIAALAMATARYLNF